MLILLPPDVDRRIHRAGGNQLILCINVQPLDVLHVCLLRGYGCPRTRMCYDDVPLLRADEKLVAALERTECGDLIIGIDDALYDRTYAAIGEADPLEIGLRGEE